MFQAPTLDVTRAPRRSFTATFWLSWTAIIVCCLLIWAAAIRLVV